nr:hypothetical protein [Tanacetum cinerariifolium]
MRDLEDAGIFDDAYDDRDEGAEAEYTNLEIEISVSPISSIRIHKDHPKEHIIGESILTMDSYKEATRHALERASSPISPAHIADAGSKEDLEEDPKEDPVNYLADEGDDVDEPSEDNADEEDEEEASKEEDDDEVEEHLVLADSSFVPTIDHVPLAKDTKTFKTDESAPTHVPSPRRHMARMSV